MPDVDRDAAQDAPGFSSRAVESDDWPFLERLYASTRTEELALVPWPDEEKRRFLHQQFTAQRTHYEMHFPDAEHLVLVIEDESAGRVWIERREDEIRLLDVALLPEHRSGGTGSAVIQGLQAEATTSGRAVTCCVELNNPRAKQLYLRLGFTVIKDLQTHELMEWMPKGI